MRYRVSDIYLRDSCRVSDADDEQRGEKKRYESIPALEIGFHGKNVAPDELMKLKKKSLSIPTANGIAADVRTRGIAYGSAFERRLARHRAAADIRFIAFIL